MKRISFEINDHSDRVDIVRALANNGYAVKVEQRTVEYFGKKVYVVVWMNDSEVYSTKVESEEQT